MTTAASVPSRPAAACGFAARLPRGGLRLDAAGLRRRASLGAPRARAATRRRRRPQFRRQRFRTRTERALHRWRRVRRRAERLLAALGGAAPLPVRRACGTAVSPLLPRIVGYMPGWAALGNDVPRDVIIEWSSWCRRPGYAAAGAARRGFSTVRAPLMFLSFADDTDYAPRAAVEALVRTYDGAASEHQHIEPRAHGLARVGHFGFFRPSARVLWPRALDWLARHTRLDRPAPAPLWEHCDDQDRNPGRRGAHRDRASREEECADRRDVPGDGRCDRRCARRCSPCARS